MLQAVARTAALMADARVPAIFEAAFEYDGIRIRVDVMERLALRRLGPARGKEQQRAEGSLPRRHRAASLRASGRGVDGFLDRASACEYRLCARTGRHLLAGFLRPPGCR